MAQDKVKALYDTFVKEGYNMESEAEFRKNLADPAKRKAAYEALKKDGYQMEAYDAFETNIGYGKAQATSAPTATPAHKPQSDVKTTPDPAAPNPQSVSSPAPAAPKAQPTWKPSEQEKIRMLHGINTIVGDFNKKSRGRVENAARITEHLTPEGRKKLKAKKFQAQLAGTPTQVMGLTPGTAGDRQQAETGGLESSLRSDHNMGGEPKSWKNGHGPMPYGQGPVPYGFVTTEDGRRKTQWLLPDGSLTTDYAEADRAEYGARRVRLRNEFIKRMLQNGLIPGNPKSPDDLVSALGKMSKEERDIAVQKQAQLDYEAPIREAVATALAQDDARSDSEQEAYMSNPSNMVGGINASLGHAYARKQAGIGDLTLIAEKAYSSLSDHYRRELVASYADYFRKHPEALHGKTVEQAAQDAAKSAVYGQVHEEYVKRNAPGSKNEFFLRKMLELNPASVALSGTVNPRGQALADMEAMDRYGAEHKGLALAGTVAGMAIDPVTYLGGAAGNLAFRHATKLAGKMMTRRAVGGVAGRYATSTLAGRITGGVAGGGANLATFEGGKDAERQVYQGGYANPERGEIEGFSFGSVLNSGVHGLGMGAVTGMVSPLVGNVADKAVKATSSLGGKLALRAGEAVVSKLLEGTVFAMPDIYAVQNMPAEKFDRLYSGKYGYDRIKDEGKKAEARKKARNDMSGDAWNDSMAMMMGFGLSHAVKTAPAVIRSLRPVKPSDGRPLSREERIHNNRSFRERVRENLDRSASDMGFTKEEREELKHKGYGKLSALFSFDPEYKSRKVAIRGSEDKEASPAGRPVTDEGDVKGGHGLVKAEDYDAEISETGNTDFDGYEAMERLMEDASVSEATRAKAYFILTGRSLHPSTVTGWRKERDEDGSIIVTSHNQHGGTVTSRAFTGEKEAQREIERIERQAELNTIDVGEQYRNAEAEFYGRESVRPEEIRKRVSEETGVEIDDTIRKEPGRRSEAEQEAVKRYVKELFPEEARGAEEGTSSGGMYEPSPEETEADRVYEEGHLLYGRIEQGDPDAGAEMDAIILRYKEAEELCEDAFGDEPEVYMARIREYPWGVLKDPGLTSDQRDAVLYYINAKAALEGILDASNEAASDKRKAVEGEVGRRTHKERGVIVPATMKIDDEPVYLIKGDVVMFPDGSDVDVRNSSDTLIILGESGEFRFAYPGQIKGVGDVIDPEEELQEAYARIDTEQEGLIGAVAEAPGDKLPGEEESISVDDVEEDVPDNAESLPDMEGDADPGTHKALGEISTEPQVALQGTDTDQQGLEIYPQEEGTSGKGSALSRIPLNEETGEPMFEAVDKDTAWDALVEIGGSDKDAADIAMAQVKQATADLEALKRKPPIFKEPALKGSPMAMAKAKQDARKKFDKEAEAYDKKLADAQARLNAWESIIGVHTSRQAELRREQEEASRQRDAERHDQAVAQFEEAQRLKAERDAEQTGRGPYIPHPDIKKKWDESQKFYGPETFITLADGRVVEGRYVYHEAMAATPSHDPFNGFQISEGSPLMPNGRSVNPRQYDSDRDARLYTEGISKEYDARGIRDDKVVQEGNMLSGNGGASARQLAARQGTDAAFVEALRLKAKEEGIREEDFNALEHPDRSFEPKERFPYTPETYDIFNADDKKSMSRDEESVRHGMTVSDDTVLKLSNEIGKFDSLGDFYRNRNATNEVLRILNGAGVIKDNEMSEYRNGDELSGRGQDLIEAILMGKIFEDEPDVIRMLSNVRGVRHGVLLAMNEITFNRTLSEKGYALGKELAEAIDLVYRARESSPEIYRDGMPVSPFGRQEGLFDEEYGDSRITDGTVLLLADMLNSGKPGDLRKVLALYNAKAQEGASGQYYISEDGEMMPPLSKNEVLTLVNEIFNDADRREQIRLVEEAVAERKRRAGEDAGRGSEGAEQTPDAGRRGEGGEERAGGNAGEAKAERELDNARRIAERHAEIERHLGTKYTFSQEQANHGEVFYKNEQGSTNLAVIPDEIFEKIGVEAMPFKLTETMAWHVYTNHAKELGLRNLDDAIDFVLNIVNNVDHVRLGKGNTFIFSVENTRKGIAHRAVTIVVKADTGEFMGIKTSGFDRMSSLEKRPVLWEKGADSTPEAIATPTVTTIKAQQGDEHMGHAEGQITGTGKIVEPLPAVEASPVAADVKVQEQGDIPMSGNSSSTVSSGKDNALLSDKQAEGQESSITEPQAALQGTEGAGLQGKDVLQGEVRQWLAIKGLEPEEALRSAVMRYFKIGYNRAGKILDAIAEENSDAHATASGGSGFETVQSVNLSPTEAQKEAGNYKKGHVTIEGMRISIENPKYSIRSGKDADGKPWETEMTMDYGYIRGTQGKDKDHIDIFLSDEAAEPRPQAGLAEDKDTGGKDKGRKVYVIDQYNKDGSFDEHKVVYGVADVFQARKSYLENYSTDWEDGRRIDVTEVSMEDFKKWAFDGRRKIKPFAEYKDVKAKLSQPEDEGQKDYSITPAIYEGKKKNTPVHRLSFRRELKEEEVRAVQTFANERSGEGRFAPKRGWLDKKAGDGSWLFRTEEDARKAGEMIGNEEAVADAQPLSAEDYREAVSPAPVYAEPKARTPEQTASQPKKPETAPMNRVDVEGLFNDLSTKGETKVSDQAEPISPEDKPVDAPGETEKPKGQFRVDDEMRDMEDELRSLLGIDDSEGDRGDLFRNPEEFTNKERMQITSLGITYALKYFDQGIVLFPDFADKMVRRMGEKIRPWLKAFYGGARDIPGYDHLPFTPAEEVKVFDVMNFDKENKDANPLRTAQGIVAESRAEAAVAEAKKEITEQRNQKRKERDEQTTADTETFAKQAEAIAGEAEATAESAVDEQSITEASEKIDEALEKVNEQLAILGYFKDEGKIAKAETKAAKAGAELAARLTEELGLQLTDLPEGMNVASADFSEHGGYVRINLPFRKGYEPLKIEIYFDRTDNGSLCLKELSTTLKRGDPESYIIGEDHKVWLSSPHYGELIDTIRDQIEKAVEAEESHNGYKRGDEVLWDRYGNGKWEKVKIEDFDTDGSPIFEAVKGIMSEKGDWSRVKPADGFFGEAKRGATKAQAERRKREAINGLEPQAALRGTETDPLTPQAADAGNGAEGKVATGRATKTMTGGKKKPSKKKEIQPEQPVGGLFGGLFDDEPINDEKETELRSRPGTGEREEGHKPRQDEPVGTSQRNEDGGTDGGGMAGRGGSDTVPDPGRGSAVSPIPSEHAVKDQKTNRANKPGDNGGEKTSLRSDHNQDLERLPEAERKNTHNNRAERGIDYAPKGVDARIRANIKAIELAQELIESGSEADSQDMAVLRQFSGWGGLGKAFNDDGYSMQIKKLLGSAYEDAVKSRKSAYYTPSYIIDTMWDIARAMEFKGGNVLEGSAGIGNILGLMPQDMSERSNIHAVEYDSTTGGILSLLYPDAKVDIQGFEATKIPNGSVDLSITNVPFITGWNVADTSGDKDLSRKFRDIHDFCIAKNIRKLKPGGIGIFITSSGTLDNSDKLRAWITNEGASDVVGAFRMNNQTFGGTGATSDIIVVRKRINGQKSPHAIDVSEVTGARIAEYDTGEVKKEKGKEVPVVKTYPMSYNKYFFEHPENMAGEMMFNFEKGETFQPTSRALFPVKGKDQAAMLKEWAGRFSDMDFEASHEDKPAYAPNYDSVGNEVKTGSMIVDSKGRLCTNMNGTAVPVMGSTPTGYSKMSPEQKAKVDAERVEKFNRTKIKGRTRQQCLKDYNELKKALADVLQYQTENADNEGLEPLLKKLNQTFDRFVGMYGNLHKNTQLAWLRNDVDYPSILALESFEERPNAEGERIRTYGKTDIFSQRVVEKEVAPKPENVKDGIIASIYMTGRIDLPYISEALGRSPEEVKKEIISSGLGFENPNTTDLEVSYEYLSGNVREKLRQAQDNNEDGRYTPNIKALERVVPMNIPAHLIEFSLGSSWITPKLYEDFIKERTGVSVRLKNAGGTWFVGTPETGTNTELNRSQGIFSEMFKSTIFGHQLMEAAITNRSITVSRTYKHSDGSSETVTDKDATQACAAKIDEIRQDFKDWARQRMQQDPEMSDEIERIYNEKFNNYVARNIPEEFIPEHFGGAAHVVNGKPFKLRPHQAKAVIRGTMQSQLLAHEVGTGKTYTLISTAMEMRRLGTARKPMIVVQNATVGQFVESAKALYPNARILTIEEADRTSEGRKNFYAKIKYNDWDMIVVPQSVFERIPDSEERQIKFIQDKIEEKLKVLEDMKEEDPDGKSMIVRQAESELEKSREELNKITQELEEKRGKKKEKDEKREAQTKHNAEVRAMEMLDRETDDVENFDEMGIDAILVDEAHEYKHLGFSTAMQRGVKGVDPSYSKKAQGVYLKTLAVKERSNGRNAIFATGTPISNTAAEIWTFMRYLLDPDMMKEYGIYYFDDFVRNFGNLQQMLEFTTSGKFKENNRFAGYVNLPELVRIWSGAADTVLTREAGGVNDKIPKLKGGKPTDIYLPQTKALRSVMLYVRKELDAYENMTGKEKKKNSHIPLVMYGIAKAAAVDARLVVAGAEDDPNSKTNACVRHVLQSLDESKAYKGTYAIFADNYQNKKSGFNLYDDIREKLIKNGVPEEQIVIMRSNMSVKKKLEIFDKVNRGDVRVILGSTFTLGTGVNIQERLHKVYHLDAPNRPMDYTQRNGRLLRQGNLHNLWGIPVEIVRFGVEDSLDVTAYQRLKTKGAIADSIMNGKELISNAMENRTMEEVEDVFGDITAQLSGSEYAMLKNQAEKQVRKYTSKLKQWEVQQTHIHNKLPILRGQIKAAEQRIEEAKKHLEIIGTGRDNKITIGFTTYPNIDAMADLFTEHNKRVKTAQEEVREGSGERTMTMNVNVGGIDFTINTKVNRKIANNGQLSFESERNMTYSCQALGMEDVPVSGSRLKVAIEDIVGNVMNGDLFRERIETANNSIERMSNEVAQLESQKGKPFEHVKELEEAEARLEEYTEKMKAELAEKEAKYADIDATVEAAEDVAFVEEEEEEETEERKLYREMEAADEILDLEPVEVTANNMTRGELFSIYRGLRDITKNGTEIRFLRGMFGKNYKPGGLFAQAVPFLDDIFEESIFAYSEADKLGDTVRPDGTIHKSHPNIDSFDNYVGKMRIEGKEYYVRLTVQNTKDNTTGVHSCFVSNVDVYERTASAETDTTIIDRPNHNQSGKESADFNSSPGYPRATEENGYQSSSSLSYPGSPRARVTTDGIIDAKLQQFFEKINLRQSKKEMEGAVKRLSEKLHSPIRLISRKEAEAEGYRRKKGWYDRETGKITVVTDNHRNVGDIADTAVHEAVGHHGLRQLFGTEEKLNNFLNEAYNISNDKIKAEIDRRTEKMMVNEVSRIQERKRKERESRGENPDSHYYEDLSDAKIEAEKQREQIRRDATEEYAADLGMKIGEEGFERMDAEELTFWGKLKGMLQKALDRLLAGLKLPKMRAWTDKEWSYVLWKSWRNLREGKSSLRSHHYAGPLAEAEDIVRREKSNFGASESRLFRDSDLGLEEAITKMKADAAAANGADFKAKQDAMRAIGGNMSKLRQAMARQREYDITTVKSVSDLARVLMEKGLLDDLSKVETKRILSAINNVVGRQDVSQYVQKVMDIMVDNQLRLGANTLGRLLSIRGSRVDARGIEVQGELDPEGQKIALVVRKSSSLSKEDVDFRMAEAENRMGSSDSVIADEAAIEYAGLQIARQYVEEIKESKNEEKELRDSIKQAKEDKDAGQMTEAAYKQYVEATNDAIRQNKIDRAEAFHSLVEQVGDVMSGSIERAKAWREAEKQRVEEIHHNANSDMEGRPTDEHHKDNRIQKIANNSAVRFLLAPLATFDQMLRMFGGKSVRGEGYLWNRYMRGWVDCAEKEYTGYQEALKTLDKKVREVFEKSSLRSDHNVKSWGDLFAMERRMPKASVRFWDGGEMRDHELTQGNLLYIYMTDKMTDGRMKLRRMGITETDVERIKNFVDPRFIQLADWMQEEYLTEKRNGYNEVHKRMFGTSMAAIENYFPLKILANARMEDVDVAEPEAGSQVLPATSTGSIIKRKRNNLALDVTGADAFSVILDHIQQMERWAAFAEYNRDLNTLLSYKRFRNQVMNMTSAYGAGKTLWNNFRNVAAMSAGAYRPPVAPLDKAAVNIAKGVTAAKVSFRLFTALKQFLSMPAYLSDSNPAYLIANIANPIGAWKWSMENLPLFEKRWKSRMAGDPRLLKSDMDWKMWRSRIVEMASRVGMSPNAFVDALTVAIGTHAMYQTKKAKYLRWGMEEEAAEKRAKQDATILFNQTQQSSEGAFLSTMQVDRSWLSVLFTVFRNSSMSYTRQLYDSLRNIGHRLTPGYKDLSEEFMAKQMRREGIDPARATENAKQEYRRGWIRDIVRVGIFGYALQLAWNLGAYLPYLIFGDNDDEKDKMWDDVWTHTMFGSVEGLTGGDVMSSAGNMWVSDDGNPAYLTKDMPLASDVLSILKKMDKDQVSAMNDVINLLVQSGLGVNPQSLTDAVVAVMDYCGEDARTSRECALLICRVLNCPQSQLDKIYFDELDASGKEASKLSPKQIAERYAQYKLRRNATMTGWAYSEEGRQKALEKNEKRALKIAKEKLNNRIATEEMKSLLAESDSISKLIREARKAKTPEAWEKVSDDDWRKHYAMKGYKRDIKELTERWLNAGTAEEADSLAGAMVHLRDSVLREMKAVP